VKKAELQIAVGATCHCLIFAVDHLGEIFELMEKKVLLPKPNCIAPNILA